MKILLDEDGIRRSITRISYEIIERNKTVDNMVLVGIKSRGDILAERIKQKLRELENIDVPLETIDITYYRDDIDRKNFELDIKDIEFFHIMIRVYERYEILKKNWQISIIIIK